MIGDYEKGIFEVEGNLQSGEAYAGNIDAAGNALGLLPGILEKHPERLFAGRTGTHQHDLGASFVFGLTDEIDVAVGVFGRNGNPFAPVYELENPSDPTSVVLKDAGITIQGGSTMLASLETELDVDALKWSYRAYWNCSVQMTRSNRCERTSQRMVCSVIVVSRGTPQ